MLKTLIILPTKTQPLDQKILAVPIVDRLWKPAQKAGFSEKIILQSAEQIQTLPESFAVISSDTLLSVEAWKTIATLTLPENTLAQSQIPSCFALRTTDQELLKTLLQDSKKLNQVLRLTQFELPPKSHCSLTPLKTVQQWLLQSLIKDTEGFMSRHVERKISLSVTRLLIHSPITPNMMTILSTLIGISGAAFFLQQEKWYHVTGALLFWLHSVLDGCDGEIARLKFLESRWGGILDFWGDNLVHMAVFLCLALGYAAQTQNKLYWLLGALAVGGTVGSAGLAYWRTMRPKKTAGPLFTSITGTDSKQKTGFESVLDFLARRDFIYLVIFLAAIGRTDLFLWMSAIGSPIYFIVLLFLSRESK